MSAPTTAAEFPDALPFRSTESINGAAAPLLLHTPGPIPPVDDEDDDEDDDRKGGGKGGNIDPDDDEDLDDEDDDDEADKQWARHLDGSAGGAGARFVLYYRLYGAARVAFRSCARLPAAFEESSFPNGIQAIRSSPSNPSLPSFSERQFPVRDDGFSTRLRPFARG